MDPNIFKVEISPQKQDSKLKDLMRAQMELVKRGGTFETEAVLDFMRKDFEPHFDAISDRIVEMAREMRKVRDQESPDDDEFECEMISTISSQLTGLIGDTFGNMIVALVPGQSDRLKALADVTAEILGKRISRRINSLNQKIKEELSKNGNNANRQQ